MELAAAQTPQIHHEPRLFYNYVKLNVFLLQKFTPDPWEPSTNLFLSTRIGILFTKPILLISLEWFHYRGNKFSHVHLCGTIREAWDFSERFLFTCTVQNQSGDFRRLTGFSNQTMIFLVSVDDGTGSIRCSYWYDQEKKVNLSFVNQQLRARPHNHESDDEETDSQQESPFADGFSADVLERAKRLAREGRILRFVGSDDNDPDIVEWFLKDAEPLESDKPAPVFSQRLFRLGDLVTVRGRLKLYHNRFEIHVDHLIRERDPNAEIRHWQECISLHNAVYTKPKVSTASVAVDAKQEFHNFVSDMLVFSIDAEAVSYKLTPDHVLAVSKQVSLWENVSLAEVKEVLDAMVGKGLLFRDDRSGVYLTNSAAAMACDVFACIAEESKSKERRTMPVLLFKVA